MSDRVPPTWVAALTGLVVQTVALVVATVLLVRDAVAAGSGGADDTVAGAVDSPFGPALNTLAAVVTGTLALVLVVVLALSVARGAGRLVALVLGLALQLPLVGFSIGALDDDAGPGPVAQLAGGALVLVGAVAPATWRWCRRPRAPRPAEGGQ